VAAGAALGNNRSGTVTMTVGPATVGTALEDAAVLGAEVSEVARLPVPQPDNASTPQASRATTPRHGTR
jgi:hypothetical protein